MPVPKDRIKLDGESDLPQHIKVIPIKSNPELAISIKTFYREEALFNCIRSIKKYCDIPYRIYIADDGPVSKEKEKLYRSLKNEGHEILLLPYNSGASYGRNRIIERLRDERFVLRMDDDFSFCKETSVKALFDVLDSDDAIGAVTDRERQLGNWKGLSTGQISDKQGIFILKDKVLTKKVMLFNELKNQILNGIRFYEIDWGRNFLLIRRELFDEIKWDENLHIFYEHLDFMLQIYYSHFKLGVIENSIHNHCGCFGNVENIEYTRIRRLNMEAKTKAFKYLLKKWDLTDIVITYTKRTFVNKVYRKWKSILYKNQTT